MSRAFSLWRLWTASVAKRPPARMAAAVRASRAACNAQLAQVSARARRERGDDARARRRRFDPSARRFVFLGVAILTHPSGSAADVLGPATPNARGARVQKYGPCSRRGAHAQLRAMTRWKRYVTRRAIGSAMCRPSHLRVNGGVWRRVGGMARPSNNLRRGHVSRENPRGAGRSNDDASRRVFAWRVRLRQRRARRRGSMLIREEEDFRARLCVSAWRCGGRRPSRDDAWKDGFGASRTPRGRVREVGSVRARPRRRGDSRRRRIDSRKKLRRRLPEWARGGGVGGASRARRRGPPRRRRRARGERASGDVSSRARGASGVA